GLGLPTRPSDNGRLSGTSVGGCSTAMLMACSGHMSTCSLAARPGRQRLCYGERTSDDNRIFGAESVRAVCKPVVACEPSRMSLMASAIGASRLTARSCGEPVSAQVAVATAHLLFGTQDRRGPYPGGGVAGACCDADGQQQ